MTDQEDAPQLPKIGDVVWLKSGGPAMTVVDEQAEVSLFTCQYARLDGGMDRTTIDRAAVTLERPEWHPDGVGLALQEMTPAQRALDARQIRTQLACALLGNPNLGPVAGVDIDDVLDSLDAWVNGAGQGQEAGEDAE